jgi:hypothetical protein
LLDSAKKSSSLSVSSETKGEDIEYHLSIVVGIIGAFLQSIGWYFYYTYKDVAIPSNRGIPSKGKDAKLLI